MGDVIQFKTAEDDYHENTMMFVDSLFNNIVENLYNGGVLPEDENFEQFEKDLNVIYNLMISMVYRVDNKKHFLHGVLDTLDSSFIL